MSTYELVTLDDGTEARQYEDGSVRVPNGHGGWQYAKRPPQAAPLITSMTAPSMALRKHEKAQRRDEVAKDKAADGLQRAVDKGMSLQTASAEDAWGYVIEKQTELATSPEEGHASTQAAKLVGTATGMMGDRASAPTVNILINISDDIAATYLNDDVDWEDGDWVEQP